MDAHNQEQNRVDRIEEQNNVDLTLRLGVGDSRPRPENSQNQEPFEPGFAMMAGEHNNPWPRVQSNASGSTSGSSTSAQIITEFNPAVSDTDMAAGQNMMLMEEFLRMILSVNHYDSMERLLNGERGVDAEPAAVQANAANVVDLPENQDDDIEDAEMELMSEDDNMDDWRLHMDEMTFEEFLEEQMIIAKAGLDEQTISDRLACFRFYPNETRVSCVICLEDLKAGDSFALLFCSHKNFHPHCITTWLTEKNECPLCKSIALPPPSP